MLNPSSKLKAEKDVRKFEIAKKLAKRIDSIRKTYRNDWGNEDVQIRQRAVALYLIDRLLSEQAMKKTRNKQIPLVAVH